MLITLRNTFHNNRSVNVRADKTGVVSSGAMKHARRELCGVKGCRCQYEVATPGVYKVCDAPDGSAQFAVDSTTVPEFAGVKVLVSSTGMARGYGCDRWKHVVNLTTQERELARRGVIVVVTGCRLSNGNSGDTFRKAVPLDDGFCHRVVRDANERTAVLSALQTAGVR